VSRTPKRALAALAVLLVLAGAWALRMLWQAGAFKSIAPRFAGRCALVKGPVGPEDITVHPRTGVAYISAADRRAVIAGKPVPGHIFAYDVNAAAPTPVDLTPDADVSFQPHGISLWTGDDGHDALFVINHPPAGSGRPAHTVEIFDLRGAALVHRATLSDPLLVMPNDLVAVGIDRFYLTNTHAHPPGFRQTLETYLQLRGANVLYYGNGGFRPVLENLVFPNGINVSRDGGTLYVAATTPRRLYVYRRDPRNERLEPAAEVFLGSGADNIEIDARGDLWIGAHPNLIAMAALLDDPAGLSPSEVLRVSRDDTGGYRVEEIYLDDGREISASSVGAVRGDRLLIGQVFGNGFLDCTFDAPGG
jgi:arylesterase/paraoxonase